MLTMSFSKGNNIQLLPLLEVDIQIVIIVLLFFSKQEKDILHVFKTLYVSHGRQWTNLISFLIHVMPWERTLFFWNKSNT